MIGDQPTDTKCGRAAGVRTIRIGAGADVVDPCADAFARDLGEAAEVIPGIS